MADPSMKAPDLQKMLHELQEYQVELEMQNLELQSSKRKQKLSEERLGLALRAAGQGIYDLDLRTGEAEVTAEYALMLGYEPDGFRETNQKWIERLHPDDREAVAAVYRAYVGGDIPEYQVEFRQKTRDGNWIWVLSLGKIMERDAAGHPLRMVGTHTDITGRKQLEIDLRQALENARATNVTMTRLLRVVAHEFRSPLGVLTGSTDILDRYGERLPPEKRFAMHGHIRGAVTQLNNLVSSVLAFNRLGVDSPAEPPRWQEIGKSCPAIAAEIEAAWSSGQSCSVRLAEGCGVVLLNEILLRRIVENLLINAFHYTPPEGSVSLQVRGDRQRLFLEVRDTGIGIPEEDHVLIFDAFYRCSNVEGRAGLGLGLYFVREAVRQMGGTIGVTSLTGQGTVMRVEIPVAASVQDFRPDRLSKEQHVLDRTYRRRPRLHQHDGNDPADGRF